MMYLPFAQWDLGVPRMVTCALKAQDIPVDVIVAAAVAAAVVVVAAAAGAGGCLVQAYMRVLVLLGRTWVLPAGALARAVADVTAPGGGCFVDYYSGHSLGEIAHPPPVHWSPVFVVPR
jgi:hypothetical protein